MVLVILRLRGRLFGLPRLVDLVPAPPHVVPPAPPRIVPPIPARHEPSPLEEKKKSHIHDMASIGFD